MAEGKKYLVARTTKGNKEHIIKYGAYYSYCGRVIVPASSPVERSIHSKKICANCKISLFSNR
jgi:hypothetical protein